MHDFTPWSALLGGALIGLSASLLLIGLGRVAGISGIFASLLFGARNERHFAAAFLLGMLGVGWVATHFSPAAIGTSPRPLGWLAVAGLLVGFGTWLGNGCTSGHGVCGLSRGSRRSFVATLVFMATGVLTLGLLRRLGVAP